MQNHIMINNQIIKYMDGLIITLIALLALSAAFNVISLLKLKKEKANNSSLLSSAAKLERDNEILESKLLIEKRYTEWAKQKLQHYEQ